MIMVVVVRRISRWLCGIYGAANQGNDLAQQKLGLLYERGDGVQKDYVQAYMWYKLGAANGGRLGPCYGMRSPNG